MIGMMNELLSAAGVEQISAAFRGPLAEASMAAQMMAKRCENEKDRIYLGSICRAVARAVCVLEQVELTRKLTDEDELRAVFSTEDLADLCRQAADTAAALLEPVGITVEFTAEQDPLTTQVDEGQIERLLYELIANGAKAMPEGGRLTVRLSRTERAAVISVGDEGHGMSPEAMERLFGGGAGEPDLSPEAGAGLGLPLARTIAEVHGGMLMVETAPEAGVRAAVALPLREERHSRLKSPAPRENRRERALTVLSGVLPPEAFLPTGRAREE